MFQMHPLNHKVNTLVGRVTRDGFLLVGVEERDTCDELGGGWLRSNFFDKYIFTVLLRSNARAFS
jgi:hypothetical protein